MVGGRARDWYDAQAKERHAKLSGRPSANKPMENLPQVTGAARDHAAKEKEHNA